MQTTDYISLAILPFQDLTGQKELAILNRSFSTDLLIELSRFRQLRVMKFPEDSDPGEYDALFETSRPVYFVEGAVKSRKDGIRINFQLHRTETRHLVWGDKVDGKLENVHEIQDKLVKRVVSILQQQIDYDLISKIRQRQKVALGAYEHWLYGMEELKKGSVEADIKAREHFEKAIEIQPDYALAHTGMSLSYFNEWSCQMWDRWNINKTGAFTWAQKAIELDEQNHVIALVLGRIFLYEGSYESAEYYFRRSLVLNPNDPNTLMQMAMYFVYLGHASEALELYEKAIQLNPFFSGYQMRFVGFIYFELGDYQKAATYITQAPNANAKIADTDAVCAAVYYYLGDYTKMKAYWTSFLEAYRRLVSKGKDFTDLDAIEWLMKLNPHRHKTNLEEFLKFIGEGKFEHFPTHSARGQEAGDHDENCFVKEDIIWRFAFAGTVAQAPEVKGFYDIQKLLMQPRQFLHCAELMGSGLEGRGEKLIDETARKQYRNKILALQSDIQEAESGGDYRRSEKLQEEYDQIIAHLSKSLGLKGKARQAGHPVEKARSAVTWRIRNAIARIEQCHPALGAHLSNAVKTGTLCAYNPDRELDWITSVR